MSFAFEQSTFSMTAECLPCCAEPEPECYCALAIPPLTSPYADYATAETAIADQTDNCIGYIDPVGDTIDAFTADDSTADTVVLSGEVSDPSDDVAMVMYCSVSAKAGSTLTINFTIESTDTDPEEDAENTARFRLFNCDGSGLDTQSDTSTDNPFTGTFTYNFASDGEYIVEVNAQGRPLLSGGQSLAASFTISSDDTMTANPVIALWDDSGTTRKLWACPKLLLPPLTESTGTWYADATAAADAITDLTSNCDGYIESLTNVAGFTATDGGTSLTLANTLTAGAMTSPVMWGGINAEDAATITVTATVGAGTAGINVSIYDDTGTLVETSGVTSSPWTSAALPYEGRYTISAAVTSSSNTTSMSAAITSSGTISVNPVQARYDVGLTCAATDDC